MPEQVEAIEFENYKIVIVRQPQTDTYVQFFAPNGAMRLVIQQNATADDIIAFVRERVDIIKEIHQDVEKRYKKSSSKGCRYQQGDIAYLLGRPFVVRVFSCTNSTQSQLAKGVRGRANIHAIIHNDLSTIDLFVFQTGSYDQRKGAFLSYAKKLFSSNVEPLLKQCSTKAQLPAEFPGDVKIRPMRNSLVDIDEVHHITWVSDRLIPYPADFLVYAYLRCVLNLPTFEEYRNDEEKRQKLLDETIPCWRDAKRILADKNSPFTMQ